MEKGTLLLTREQVASLLGIDECIAAVEAAFNSYAEGKTADPAVLGVHASNGGFHIKAAVMDCGRWFFVSKINANFPGNPKQFQLPTIQGIIAAFDAENGRPLSLMDSTEITVIRTGAATAVAAKHLSRADSRVITICGCGKQGRISLEAISKVRPLERAFAFDIDPNSAERFAEELSRQLPIEVKSVSNLAEALRESDICVTCTTSKHHFIEKDEVPPGMFIAAVGADNEEKQEIDPKLLQASKVVVDHLGQCLAIGDLHHAVQLGLMKREDVHAEIGEVIAKLKPGRTSAEEVIIFDSTGTALQDVAASAIVYDKAVRTGIGMMIDFST